MWGISKEPTLDRLGITAQARGAGGWPGDIDGSAPALVFRGLVTMEPAAGPALETRKCRRKGSSG